MPFLWLGEALRPYVPPPVEPPLRVDPVGGGAAIQPAGREGTGRALEAPGRPREGPTPPPGNPYAGADREREWWPRQPAVVAAQIMTTPVITLSPDTTVPEARALLRRHGVRHFPVVTDDGRLAGLVSDRYLLGAAPSHFDVGDLMARRVLTATPDTAIRELAKVLIDEGIGCLPIVDGRRVLVGIVTTTDILRCVTHPEPVELWA
jgi:CBS domain-containing protein